MIRRINDPRELRGLAILSQPDTIIQTGQDSWDVRSQSKDAYYTVTRAYLGDRIDRMHGRATWSCTCPDHTTRSLICKHIHAVQFSLKLGSDIEKESVSHEIAPAAPLIVCPFCNGDKIGKWGTRKTKFGTVQRFFCRVCNHKFVVDKGFSRMKNKPEVITETLDLYFKGLSQRKIADHLKQFENVSVDQSTILRWVKKYLALLAKYSEKYKADVGGIWHSDETTIFIKKNGEKKYYQWIWNVMDAKTRYLLACQVTETRFKEDARKPLRKAKEMTDRRPEAIVTDGLQGYRDAIKAEFYGANQFVQNPHVRLRDFQTKPNNNILERLNGTFRERTKVVRSFDSGIGAQEFATGMQVYYNYLRPHQGIGGMIPAQVANIPIDFDGNRWETMIGLAVESEKKIRYQENGE
jgi:transposase-like protein